jgi:hypothetical protein
MKGGRPTIEQNDQGESMNDGGSGFAISDTLARALDNLADIHKQMRWLELAHMVSPSDEDLPDYRMLVDDLTATLANIVNEITSPTHPDPGNPAALAATAFPLTIGTAMNTQPAQTSPRTRGAPPGGPNARPEP